ncbi:MAG: hypothetical protein JWQ09_863 [Segetibacter sp.]|nr:hypothetical protein [Segetibacter sp.]
MFFRVWIEVQRQVYRYGTCQRYRDGDRETLLVIRQHTKINCKE